MGTRAHLSEDQYYLAAFAQGRSAMQFISPAWVLIRTIAPFVIGALIIALLIYRFVL